MPSEGSTPPQDPLPVDLLQYLPEYKVIICASCRYAIQPNAISRHLKEIHRIHRGRRKPFMQYISTLDLDDPGSVIRSKIIHFPVPLLPVQNGLCCEHDGCEHLCVTSKRMKSHWASVHKSRAPESYGWHSTPLQTFFKGNLLSYFTKPSSLIPWVPHCVIERKAEDTVNISITHGSSAEPTNDPRQNLAALDKKLFDHYVACTSMSLASDETTKSIWQTTVPQFAFQHSFVMHGILACSALHIASLSPDCQQEQIITARSHQDLALPLFRSAIENPNSNNCDAILIFTHLLVVYSFATERLDEHLLLVNANSSDTLPSWLHFLRSGCSLLCDVWGRLESGPVKALAQAWDIPVVVSEDYNTKLVDHIISMVLSQEAKDEWTIAICRTLNGAAVDLGWAFSCTQAVGDNFSTWDALRIWPMRISIDYMKLLSKEQPGALILLAHYCILLRKVETHWYFEGRATRLLSTVLERLEARWHCYVAWPLEEVGIRIR